MNMGWDFKLQGLLTKIVYKKNKENYSTLRNLIENSLESVVNY